MILLIVFLVLVLSWVVNGTFLFFNEKSNYPADNYSHIMDPRAMPINIQNGNDSVVYCLHGFPASPATYLYYSTLFPKKGYDFVAPLLPGYGRRPEDFEKSNFKMWYAYAKDRYLKLRKKYKHVYVIGQSMGGALVLKLAEEFSSQKGLAPDAIVTVSAPVFLNSLLRHGVVKNWGLYISGFLSLLLPAYIPDPTTNSPADRWVGYHGLFPRQVHSLKLNLKPIRKNLSKITVPIYLAQSLGDKTVPFANLNEIASGVSSKIREKKVFDLRKEKGHHHALILEDKARDILYHDISNFFQRAEKAQISASGQS